MALTLLMWHVKFHVGTHMCLPRTWLTEFLESSEPNWRDKSETFSLFFHFKNILLTLFFLETQNKEEEEEEGDDSHGRSIATVPVKVDSKATYWKPESIDLCHRGWTGKKALATVKFDFAIVVHSNDQNL